MKNSRFAVATHIMTGLAVHQGELVSSNDLAASVNTNPVVIRRLLGDLQKAGLIKTHAGKNGGARLAREPKAITLKDIYAAVNDGEVFAFNPNDPNRQCQLSCQMKSVLEPVFENAQKAMLKELSRVRLSQVVKNLQLSRT
jgi:Rrf2 family protein